ncbi:MAG: hypothetical protein FGM35_04795 [Rhodocyclaceae bacterium]|jgi:hypothetical protein|nr:hypothetical protein [Rhodocyclaceae bacterium]
MSGIALFLVVSFRALIELVIWVLLGRAVLSLLAGRRAGDNTILVFFDVLLGPPRRLVSRLMPGLQPLMRDGLLLLVLAVAWVGLAFCKAWLILDQSQGLQSAACFVRISLLQ